MTNHHTNRRNLMSKFLLTHDISLQYACEQASQECPPGTYKPSNGSQPCTPCPANYYSTSLAATSVATCTACPPNSRSAAGAPSLLNCSCYAGFTGSGCVACEAGLYKDFEGQDACRQCPVGAVAVSATECQCTPGYTGAYNVSVYMCTCVTCWQVFLISKWT